MLAIKPIRNESSISIGMKDDKVNLGFSSFGAAWCLLRPLTFCRYPQKKSGITAYVPYSAHLGPCVFEEKPIIILWEEDEEK